MSLSAGPSRIFWLLTEMGLDCEIAEHSITDGSLRRPDYLAKSPAGRVPALEIDGRTLFESGAITNISARPGPSMVSAAPGHSERAEYLEWLHYAETMAHLIANLNLQWVFLRDPSMRSPTLLKMDARRLALTLAPLEATLARQDHPLASGFSGADTMLGYNLLAVPRFVRLDPYPAIGAYLARIAQRPAYIAARARDGKQQFYRQDFYEVADG